MKKGIKFLNILYTGAFRFPDQDAAAKRVLANAIVLNKLGHQVFFAGWEEKERAIDLFDDGYIYKGFKYKSQAEFRKGDKPNAVQRLSGFLFRGRRTLRWLSGHNEFDMIIAYNPPALFALGLLFFTKKNNIKLVLDSTEWYESSHLVGGKWGLASFENCLRMHVIYPKFKSFIVISKYLKSHFMKKNKTVINIPPLLTQLETIKDKNGLRTDHSLRIIYAGSPGKKDDIYSLISILPDLNKLYKFPIILRLIGPSIDALKHEMINLNINYKLVAPFLEVYGKVPMGEVKYHYEVSDLSFIFRENKRYAKAGFPTKFVESMAYGVPVIANKVGDIQNYIVDYDVGFLIEREDILNDISLIVKSFIENKEVLDNKRINCYILAKRKFIPDVHLKNLAKIL